jgi:phycobilisome core linker protein
MRMFKVTACVPSQTRIRTQRELQNTYFTKLVSFDNWFKEQQRIMKMGGKILKVQLATGKQGTNTVYCNSTSTVMGDGYGVRRMGLC